VAAALTDPTSEPQTETRDTRFRASEVKFLVELELAERIRGWARARLDADPHGAGAAGDEYDVSSLYFDTDQFDVYSRRDSYGRGKYRIRRYGGGPDVFLERKLRTGRILAKRRTRVPAGVLPALAAPGLIAGDGRWFHRRLIVRDLAPRCQVTYTRMARQRPTSYGPMRLTIDDRFGAAGASVPMLLQQPGRPFLEHAAILELKFRGELPSLFKELIETFALLPEPLSKYRLAMDAITLTPAGDRHPLERAVA
jgi:hypothetical protein